MKTPYSLIDCHCHLDFPEFDNDRHEVIQRAIDAGVASIIIPGVRQSTWQRISGLCQSYETLRGCYGLHPYFVNDHQIRHLEKLEEIAGNAECTAIGECGLDYRDGQADKTQQLEYFTAQLDIANNVNKPVVIHSVRATETVIAQIKKYPGLIGMVHSYSGSAEQAQQLIDLGFMISIGGSVTYERAARLRKTVSALPAGGLLLETDAPDQSDSSHHDNRNEPAFIIKVLDCIARLRNTDAASIATQTTQNAHRLFGR